MDGNSYKGQSIQQTATNFLGLKPVQKRGGLLPLVRDADGSLTFGYPQFVVDAAEAFLLPGHVAQGGSYTPQDVSNMALDVGMMAAPVGYATAPRGALAIGGSRRAGVSDEQLKALSDLARKKTQSFDEVLLGKKNIGKTVRSAGFSDENLGLGKELIQEMYQKALERKELNNFTDPLIQQKLRRPYNLEKFKKTKKVRDLAKALGWRKDALQEATKYYDTPIFDKVSNKATLESIGRNAKKYGYNIRHNSGKKSAKNASSLYLQKDGVEIRVSDHYLPDTPQRRSNHEVFGAPRWDGEYILWNPKSLDEIFKELDQDVFNLSE